MFIDHSEGPVQQVQQPQKEPMQRTNQREIRALCLGEVAVVAPCRRRSLEGARIATRFLQHVMVDIN